MMDILLVIIIVIIVLIIGGLSISLLLIIKNATYLSKKEKNFCKFVIDMYIDYAEELEINDPRQHEKIVNELRKIKEKL
jgi:hypothetical protein